MGNLKNRIRRLEVFRDESQHCQLCGLILQAAGTSPSEAAALARHPPHTLESLIRASFEDNEPVSG